MIRCVTPDGSYLVADTLPPGAVQVPERPNPCCTWDAEAGEWIEDPALLWDVVRAERAPLLVEADHAWNKAADLDQSTVAISEYRQALRDITGQPDPREVAWPTKPW